MESKSLPLSFWIIFAVGLTIANICVYRTVLAPQALIVRTLSVGKAEESNHATLVKTPSGKTLLIDVGGDASILRALGESLPPWQRSLDTIILTGDKAAQIGGLASVESRYRVREVLRAGTAELPYGATILFDTATITITAPGKYELK